MKKTMLITIAALLFGTAGAQAQDKVTLQLKWVVQAQFAGYLVAKDKGFYKEAGLDVTIKPGGPTLRRRKSSPAGRRCRGRMDAGCTRAREKGVALVNIAQPFKRSGMMLTAAPRPGSRPRPT